MKSVYIVNVQCDDGPGQFFFPTKKGRDGFCKSMKDKGLEYVFTTEKVPMNEIIGSKMFEYKLGLIEAELLKVEENVNDKLNHILEFLGHDITTIDDIAYDAVIEELEGEA